MQSNIKVVWKHKDSLLESDLQECAYLFSNHYGHWSKSNKYIKGRIKLKEENLKKYIKPKNSYATLAYIGQKLVGYALSQRLHIEGKGDLIWVTQLVVHVDYRSRGVATKILRAIWSPSDCYGWGLVSANPYAIRALENATLRQCSVVEISKNWCELRKVALNNIFYLDNSPLVLSDLKTSINTKFDQNLSETRQILNKEGSNWKLGNINDGEEWVAFTFKDQPYISNTKELVNKWIADCDETVVSAYEGMSLDVHHSWTKYAQHEVEYFISKSNPLNNQRILDVGCGNGRHSRLLSKMGFQVTGIDFSEKLISEANDINKTLDTNLVKPIFQNIDIRQLNASSCYDHAICLYDVVGSFADDVENFKIIEAVYESLKQDATFLISIINGELAEHVAVKIANMDNLNTKLLDLKPSSTMNDSGNIFNPEYFIWEADNGVAYRREIFKDINKEPFSELVVRDCRYKAHEIVQQLSKIGFKNIEHKYVKLGDWNLGLESTNNRAKEILIWCQKK